MKRNLNYFSAGTTEVQCNKLTTAQLDEREIHRITDTSPMTKLLPQCELP